MNKILISLALIALTSCFHYNTFLSEDDFQDLFENLQGKGDITLHTNCDDKAVFHNSAVNFTPTKVKTNTPVKAEATGSSAVDVHIKELQIILKWNGKKLTSLSQPINKDLEHNETFTYSYENKIPFFIPGGSYDIIAQLVDNSGTPLSCLSAHFDW